MKKWGIRKRTIGAKVDEGVFEVLKKISKEREITISSLINEILKKALDKEISKIKKEKEEDILDWLGF